MPFFKKIGIVGVGVIGASLGLSIRRVFPNVEIIGVSSKKTIDEALSAGAIDTGFVRENINLCLEQSDLIFLCTPISHILEILPRVAESVRPGTMVTDVGSTKKEIVDNAGSCFPEGVYFLGGHPMAGNEGRGVKWADALLFENAVYVLTPSRPIPVSMTRDFGDLIEKIGAKVIFMGPGLHDRVAAMVSHLPQILAVALMNFVTQDPGDAELFLKLAAGGFRDMTRIASSPFDIWHDIISTNQDQISRHIDGFISVLGEVQTMLGKEELGNLFQKAARNRLSIPRDTKGFLKAHFDLSVRVEDRPGVIAAMTGVLADRDINIKDIEVLKVREGDAGTIRLSFETEKDRSEAGKLLDQIGFSSRYRD